MVMDTEKKSTNRIRGKNGGARPGAGRPKGRKNLLSAELKELAQTHGEEALRTIVEVMQKGEPSMRLAAARELLDRGYGKAVQATEISGPNGTPVPLSIDVSFK